MYLNHKEVLYSDFGLKVWTCVVAYLCLYWRWWTANSLMCSQFGSVLQCHRLMSSCCILQTPRNNHCKQLTPSCPVLLPSMWCCRCLGAWLLSPSDMGCRPFSTYLLCDNSYNWHFICIIICIISNKLYHLIVVMILINITLYVHSLACDYTVQGVLYISLHGVWMMYT